MKKERIIITITFISFLILIPLLSIAEEQENEKIEGLIDINYSEFGSPKVEVNLSGSLLSIGIEAMPKDKSELKKFLADLKAIKVRIYDKERLSGKNIEDIIKFFDDALAKNKWESIARINDNNTRVNVSLLKNENKKDIVSGIFVFVEEKNEIIIVNLAGNINIVKLPELAKMSGFNFDMQQFGGQNAEENKPQEASEPPAPPEPDNK